MLELLPPAAAALARPLASRRAADLLAAVLADSDAAASRAVARLGLDAGGLVAAAREADDTSADDRQIDPGWWLRRADEEARRHSQGLIGTEHLLLALLRTAPLAAACAALGSSARALRGQLWRVLYDASPGGEWRPAGPGRAPDEPAPTAHPALAAIAAEEPVVGLSWATARRGRPVQTATYGWADPVRSAPVAADTRFRVGSVTKIATALLVLRLRDHGMVDIDEPATAQLRSLRLLDRDGAPSPATVRQLLTHTAGLPRGSGLRHYTGPLPATRDLFAHGIRADRPAGQWSYSNLGFVALGALAADLLGAPFGQCLQDWVLGPLGLTESASLQRLPSGRGPADQIVARGHSFDAGQIFPVRPSAVLAVGAGELVASARDTAVLVAAAAGSALLSAASVREMLTPHARLGPLTWQGLGIWIEHHGSVRLAGHKGTNPGFDAAAYACPETGESVALLANANTGLLTDQVRAALQAHRSLSSRRESGGRILRAKV
jgi:CubicO group peptidase (beta-lactamase class C family)